MNETSAFEAMMVAVRDTIVWPPGAAYPAVVKENTDFSGAKEYVLVCVEPGRSEQRTQGTRGARTWKRPGTLVFAIHVPLGIGTSRARELADAIRTSLEGEKIGGVIYRAMSDMDKGKTKSHYYLVVGLVFEYYEHK